MNPPTPHDDAAAERRLFRLLVLLNAALCVYQIATRRLPRGHDTLASYILQYLFLAHASGGDGVALWFPGVAQGAVTNLLFESQGGLFQMALLPFASFLRECSFLPLFHFGMFVDEMLLLAGVWRLGKRAGFSPAALFFVGAAATGSDLWTDHFFFNHRLVYALPMILSLLHDFLDTGSRWKLFLGTNLLALQFMGNAPYLAIFIGAVVVLYFGAYVWIFRRRLPSAAPFRPRATDLLWIPANAGVLVAILVTLTQGTGQIAAEVQGRTPGGSVPLDRFLTYGGNLNPLRYADAALGCSPSLDYSLFCGFLTLAFVLLALPGRPGRKTLHGAIVVVVILLFSTGFTSLVPFLSHALFPGMEYARYVSLLSPVVRLFLVFLAGFGFDALLAQRERLAGPARLVASGMIAISVATAALAVAAAAGSNAVLELPRLLLTAMPDLAPWTEVQDPCSLATLWGSSALGAAGAATALFGLTGRRPAGTLLVGLVLALHAADLFRWKVQMVQFKTVALSPAQGEIQRIRPVPYLPARAPTSAAGPRFAALSQDFFRYGSTYDFTDAFLHVDPLESRFRSLTPLRPVSELRQAGVAPGPLSRISGGTTAKLQVFSRAHAVPAGKNLAALLRDPSFAGNILLLAAPATGTGEGPLALSADERLLARPEILRFDFNGLGVRVAIPERHTGAWLLYCDAWHPGWTATVNGRAVPVERGFLAYKAVPLAPGENVVEFRFRAPARAFSAWVLVANSILWVALLSWVMVGLLGAEALRSAPISSPGLDIRRGSP